MGIASLVSWVEGISLYTEVRGHAIEGCQTTDQFRLLRPCMISVEHTNGLLTLYKERRGMLGRYDSAVQKAGALSILMACNVDVE